MFVQSCQSWRCVVRQHPASPALPDEIHLKSWLRWDAETLSGIHCSFSSLFWWWVKRFKCPVSNCTPSEARGVCFSSSFNDIETCQIPFQSWKLKPVILQSYVYSLHEPSGQMAAAFREALRISSWAFRNCQVVFERLLKQDQDSCSKRLWKRCE